MAEQNDSPKLELFALWENTSKSGKTYFTGRMGKNRIVAFVNENRKSEKEPSLRVYIQADTPKDDNAAHELDDSEQIPF